MPRQITMHDGQIKVEVSEAEAQEIAQEAFNMQGNFEDAESLVQEGYYVSNWTLRSYNKIMKRLHTIAKEK